MQLKVLHRRKRGFTEGNFSLGTEAPYLKGLAQQFFYFKLPKNMVAALGLRVGIGQTFREDRDALLPIAERFWVGGATTLRGFALEEVYRCKYCSIVARTLR